MDRLVEGCISRRTLLSWDMFASDGQAAAAIRLMAERHRVTYTETAADVLADHITRLSGDDVVLDEAEVSLIALQRAGYLSRRDAVLLQAEYLRQTRP